MKKFSVLAGFALFMMLASPHAAEARGRFVFSFGFGGPVYYAPYAYYPPYPAYYYYPPYPVYYPPYYYSYPAPAVGFYGRYYHGPRFYRGVPGRGYYRGGPRGHAYGRYGVRDRGRR